MSSLFVAPRQSPTYGGENYASASYYLFDSGTLTPAVTYQDADLTTAHAHPIVADGGGVFPAIWLDPAETYRVQLRRFDGSTVYDIDPYPGSQPTSQAVIGNTLWPQTNAELAAGVTPSLFYYPPGELLRYGAAIDGVTSDSAAWQRAIDQNLQGGPAVYWVGNSAINTELNLGSRLMIKGAGRTRSLISYTGTGVAFANNTATRIYDVSMRDFSLQDTGTGTIGVELEDVATAHFENLLVDGFGTGIEIDSTVNGYSIYNRFFNVTCANATIGWDIQGPGSNSNSFIASRCNVCTTGFKITDSNNNEILYCQIENGTTGISITSTTNALSDRTTIIGNRFEDYTTNYDITSSNVRGTYAQGNHHVTGVIIDNGATSAIDDLFGAVTPGFKRISAAVAAAGGAFLFERSTSGGASLPAMRIVDSVTSAGTPVTLQIETERSSGKFFSGTIGAVEKSYLDATGRLMLTGAAPTVAAGQAGYGATTSATVGAAGGAAAQPATPVGYLIVNIAGTNYKIPYHTS